MDDRAARGEWREDEAEEDRGVKKEVIREFCGSVREAEVSPFVENRPPVDRVRACKTIFEVMALASSLEVTSYSGMRRSCLSMWASGVAAEVDREVRRSLLKCWAKVLQQTRKQCN